MHYDLFKVRNKIDINNITLKEIALYFEKYHGYTCKITTENRFIKFKIDKSYLPHLIGMHYAFMNYKDKNKYKGVSGFELIKNGKITIDDLKSGIKRNTQSKISWQNVKNRIEFLPMFFNTLESKMRFRIIDVNKIYRNTKMQGNYALFKTVKINDSEIYPLLTLKEINRNQIVIETFIIEPDIKFLGALDEEKILSIELIDPLDGTRPVSYIREIVHNS